MKNHREIRRLWGGFFGLFFLCCLNPKPPDAASLGNSSHVNRSPLIGTWVIVEQSTTPLMIIPSCKPIRTGTTVQFTQTTFEVYIGTSRTPCNAYAYKTSNTHVSFIKGDMLSLCSYELTPNTLKLASTNFFIPDESENLGVENKTAPVNQPVIITLKRK